MIPVPVDKEGTTTNQGIQERKVASRSILQGPEFIRQTSQRAHSLDRLTGPQLCPAAGLRGLPYALTASAMRQVTGG